jgi:hypothetical protein
MEITEKYVKQTYEALSNNNLNLENVAIQISQLPIREQHKFFRLLLNFADVSASKKQFKSTPVTMKDIVELSERVMGVVYEYYEEQE